jgi:hypothetical protein
MSLQLQNLDSRTRTLMRAEVDLDVTRNQLFLSERLSNAGRDAYLPALCEAIARGDADTFAMVISSRGFLNRYEMSHRHGMPYGKAVPRDAHIVLAHGEYNRYYLRALCVRAEQDEISHLEIYRARVVHAPRWNSEARIGKLVPAAVLLKDLRSHVGVDTALGLPNGPNSGLSARLPTKMSFAS